MKMRGLFISLMIISVVGYHLKIYFHYVLMKERGDTSPWLLNLFYVLLPVIDYDKSKNQPKTKRKIFYSTWLFWSSFFAAIIAGIIAYQS